MTQLIFGEQFEIRDMRHKEKFQIDDAYLNGYAKKCGVYATGVYVSLCRHANKEQSSWPSIRKMSEELSVSPTMIQKGIQKLKKYNIIFIQKIGKGLNNRYFLVDKSKWVSVPPCDTVECATTDMSGVPPATSQCATTDMPLRKHSKDTHNKEGSSFKNLMTSYLNGDKTIRPYYKDMLLVESPRGSGIMGFFIDGAFSPFGGTNKDLTWR